VDCQQYKDLMALPRGVQRLFGHALSLAQAGKRYADAKVLKGFGDAGVLEVIENDEEGTCRAVYTIRYEEAIFVLHCFQKKKQAQHRTPKRGHGNYPRAAQEGRNVGKGAAR
jgi:phage-related protein